MTISEKPFVKNLPTDSSEYFEILGKNDSINMRSGLVSLVPGKEVGWHSTGDYEELLIILRGEGTLMAKGFPEMKITSGQTAYNPPHTDHNVINNGTQILKYIYIVAKI